MKTQRKCRGTSRDFVGRSLTLSHGGQIRILRTCVSRARVHLHFLRRRNTSRPLTLYALAKHTSSLARPYLIFVAVWCRPIIVVMFAAVAYACRLLSILALFWGAYATYKVLKPRVIVDDEGGGENATAAVLTARRAGRRRTLLRFVDVYDTGASGAGGTMLCYWAVLSALHVYEASPTESLLSFFVPFYWEAKFVLLLALLVPASGAPRAIFTRLLHPAITAAARCGRQQLLPAAASTAAAVAGSILPPLFARAAPLLHPAELRAWFGVLENRKSAIAEAQSSSTPAASESDRKRGSSPAPRRHRSENLLAPAASGSAGSTSSQAEHLRRAASAAAAIPPRRDSANSSDDDVAGVGCHRVRTKPAEATSRHPLPPTVTSRRRGHA